MGFERNRGKRSGLLSAASRKGLLCAMLAVSYTDRRHSCATNMPWPGNECTLLSIESAVVALNVCSAFRADHWWQNQHGSAALASVDSHLSHCTK